MKKSILLLFIISISFAQQSWIRTYGGTNDDVGYSVQQTTDGGYIVAGFTGLWATDTYNVYIVKTDSIGDTLWTRTYGGTNGDYGFFVQQTTDGGYIVSGYTSSFGAGNSDVYLIKTDSTGDTLWTKTYGGTGTDIGKSVRQTLDGGYIIAGSTTSFGAGGYDVYLVKTDSIGDTLWTKIYGGPNHDEGYSVQQTTDGGYIVSGYTMSFGAGSRDVWLIKTNASGDTLWTKTFGGTNDDYGFFVQQTTDGGYIIAGCFYTAGTLYDVYLVKTDSTGNTLWTKTYGGTNHDISYSVQQTTDGRYIVAGFTESFGAGSRDVWLIKIFASGNMQWNRTYGGTGWDVAISVRQTSDGGYIVTGVTLSFGAGFEDVYLIKTDANGYAAVEERKGRTQNLEARLNAVPNPFTFFARIPGYEKEDFTLSDIAGRLVGKYKGAKIGENLPAGIYFIVPQNKNLKPLRIVKIR